MKKLILLLIGIYIGMYFHKEISTITDFLLNKAWKVFTLTITAYNNYIR